MHRDPSEVTSVEAVPAAKTDASRRPGAAAEIEPLSCSAVLTHHWLVRRRGGERVLEALCELLPDAPIYALVHDPAGFEQPDAEQFTGTARPIRTSILQHIPGARRHYPKLLPLMPFAARRMKLPPVDLVVGSDAAIAKAMTPDSRSKVVCYCHSPMRYVWDLSDTYGATLPAMFRPLWGPLVRRIRIADRRAADRVDQFVANSRHVADRIRRHYGRDGVVVYPPVDLPTAPATGPREDFYLCVGQHVPYKRLDLAVEACRKLGRELVVIGEGPDVRRYQPLGHSNVRWLGWQPSGVANQYYRCARGLLFPGEEDFGIVPVEAMSHGCPVIAYGVGGATESVIDGQTGVWFEQQTAECLVAAIERAEGMAFDPVAMHTHAQRFSRVRFLREMRAVLMSVLGIPAS